MSTYTEDVGPAETKRMNLWHEVQILENMVVETGGSSTISEDTTNQQFSLGNNIRYRVNGQVYHKASGSNQWDLSSSSAGFSEVGSDEYCYILLTLESDGTTHAYKGKVADSFGEARLPMPPDGEAAIGYIKVNNLDLSSDEDISSSGDCSVHDGYDLS